MDLARRAYAEAAGTALLVLVGCGAIVLDAATGRLGPLGIAAAFTVAVAAPVWLVRPASGAHLNPAVSIALALRGLMPWREVPHYVGAQTLGALGAALVLHLGAGDVGALGATQVRADVVPAEAFALEAVATAALLLVILVVATGRPLPLPVQALAIGATVGLASALIGPMTGASLNPARSLGPALVGARLDVAILLYLAAPVVGAVVGAAAACRVLPRALCCAPLVAPPVRPEGAP